MKYVSEEELRKWLITDGCEEGHCYIDEDDFVCMDWQDNPTKTGRWINNMNGTFTCDKCGCKHSKSNYCPNCGRKMEEF